MSVHRRFAAICHVQEDPGLGQGLVYVKTLHRIRHFEIPQCMLQIAQIDKLRTRCTEAVVCADTVNRLSKFWQDQEVLYNFKADICTRSRSHVSAILD